MLYKVAISDQGIITRCSDNVEIGTISNYYYSDYRKFPNTLKKQNIKLNTGETVKLMYGGYINGTFNEVCHLRCVWGISCLSYKKCNCMLKYSDVGFYVDD